MLKQKKIVHVLFPVLEKSRHEGSRERKEEKDSNGNNN